MPSDIIGTDLFGIEHVDRTGYFGQGGRRRETEAGELGKDLGQMDDWLVLKATQNVK